MRKIISILLLCLLLYNIVGYQAFFYWQTQVLSKKITSTIDKGEVDESQLLVFKIPLPPYNLPNNTLERVEGSFQYRGVYYEMVNQKIENDSIHIYCLPNNEKRELVNKLNDHIQTHVADFKHPKPDKPTKPLLTLQKEYLSQGLIELPLLFSQLATIAPKPYRMHFSFPSLSLSVPPPEVV